MSDDMLVHLVTQGPFSLFLGKAVASSIRRSLTRLGVEIIDQTTVAAVHARNVVIDQAGEIPCDLFIEAPVRVIEYYYLIFINLY